MASVRWTHTRMHFTQASLEASPTSTGARTRSKGLFTIDFVEDEDHDSDAGFSLRGDV